MPILLIVDMQNDFVQRLEQRTVYAVTANINALARCFERNGLPIYMIVTEHAPDGSDALLRAREENFIPAKRGTPGALPVSGLELPKGAHVIKKTKYSGFFGTSLPERLADYSGTVVVTGVNTHACVRATAVDACQRDVQVIVPSDAVASYDAEYHRESLRYLGSRIGRVMTTMEAISVVEAGAG